MSESPRRFMIIMYCGNSPVQVCYAEADCYADAVLSVQPGNDLVKIEVIALN